MAKKKIVEAASSFVNAAKTIVQTPMTDEVEKSFLEYSYAVIYSRALPDIRDGLKPVARRILYTMFEEGFTPDKSYVKSARPVAACMGTYHPHGDSSIYEAMVRLAQPASLMVPLVDGYGNWGGTGVPAAASRYTEARLAKEAMLLLGELKEGTVDTRPNYDGETIEPIVLPVQFPNLLVNGISGIAVGFATNMPAHNPTEVIDAARWLLTHPNADLDKLMEFIPGPDFPTGGSIIGMDAIKEAYATGRGVFRIRGRASVESVGRGRNQIIFDELPYGVSASKIIEKAKEAISKNQLQGVADIKDLTDRRNGTRLVFETKVGVNPNALLLDLYKLTPLEDSFGINNVALVNGEPKLVGLKEILEVFIAQRIDIITRRTKFRKDKRESRLHLVEGILKALANIDEVIRIIRGSANTADAQEKLMKKFKLDDIQANYILDIPLRRLTKYDSIELNDEKKRLLEELKALNAILNSDKVLREVIAKELEDVRKVLDRPRASVLVGGNLAEHLEAAKAAANTVSLEVEDGPCGVFLTAKGGIVRSDKLKPSKPVLSAIESTVRGKFVAVTNKGNAYRLDTILVGTREATISNILPTKLGKGESVIALTPTELKEGMTGGIALGTKNGSVKITAPQWPVRSDEFTVINLEDNDEVLSARWIDNIEDYDLAFISTDTSFLSYPANKVRPQGLSGSGMAGIKLADGAKVSSFSVISKEEKNTALVITHTGKSVKATPFVAYPQKGRATGGVRSMKFLKTETELVLSTVSGSGSLFAPDGTIVPLPKIDSRRDASGTPVKADSLF